jgi:hypothetical protein
VLHEELDVGMCHTSLRLEPADMGFNCWTTLRQLVLICQKIWRGNVSRSAYNCEESLTGASSSNVAGEDHYGIISGHARKERFS